MLQLFWPLRRSEGPQPHFEDSLASAPLPAAWRGVAVVADLLPDGQPVGQEVWLWVSLKRPGVTVTPLVAPHTHPGGLQGRLVVRLSDTWFSRI